MTAPSSSTSTAAVIAPETIAELRALLAKATPGPWRRCGGATPFYTAIHSSTAGYVVFGMADRAVHVEGVRPIDAPGMDEQDANGRLIAAAVNALPGLLTAAARGVESQAEIAALKVQNERMREVLGAFAKIMPATAQAMSSAMDDRFSKCKGTRSEREAFYDRKAIQELVGAFGEARSALLPPAGEPS